MRAVDRTCGVFVESVREALPQARLSVVRSSNAAGHSRYVYINTGHFSTKVRISDHPVGMRRAMSGECSLWLTASAKPASWAVWLSRMVRKVEAHEPA